MLLVAVLSWGGDCLYIYFSSLYYLGFYNLYRMSRNTLKIIFVSFFPPVTFLNYEMCKKSHLAHVSQLLCPCALELTFCLRAAATTRNPSTAGRE